MSPYDFPAPGLPESLDYEPSPPAPRFLKVAMVLGDGSTIHYRVQLGEVLRLRAPEQLLDRLRAEHWIGIEVTEA